MLSQSEVITMMTLFHYGSFRNMKHFYIHYVQKLLGSEFPRTVSYNRFSAFRDTVKGFDPIIANQTKSK